MKFLSFTLTFLLITPAIFADNRDVDHDPQADFSKFKTFMIREGTIAAKAPDLDNPLVREKVDEAFAHNSPRRVFVKCRIKPISS